MPVLKTWTKEKTTHGLAPRSGSGPAEGWISIRISGKELATRVWRAGEEPAWIQDLERGFQGELKALFCRSCVVAKRGEEHVGSGVPPLALFGVEGVCQEDASLPRWSTGPAVSGAASEAAGRRVRPSQSTSTVQALEPQRDARDVLEESAWALLGHEVSPYRGATEILWTELVHGRSVYTDLAATFLQCSTLNSLKPQALTLCCSCKDAFHKFGTLPADNYVTKVVHVEQLPHSGFDAAGGAGHKVPEDFSRKNEKSA